MNDNRQAASPILVNHGYCVFAFNYGGSSPTSDIQGTGDIAASAQQLAAFVSQVLAATGAADMLNALDPDHPVRVPCLVVLPVTGPAGPVPSF